MMVAMGGPEASRICDCHSLRRRSGARYSVRISVKLPVICRVTIFTPLTDEFGDVRVVTYSSSIASGIFSSFSRPRAGRAFGDSLYRQTASEQKILIFAWEGGCYGWRPRMYLLTSLILLSNRWLKALQLFVSFFSTCASASMARCVA